MQSPTQLQLQLQLQLHLQLQSPSSPLPIHENFTTPRASPSFSLRHIHIFFASLCRRFMAYPCAVPWPSRHQPLAARFARNQHGRLAPLDYGTRGTRHAGTQFMHNAGQDQCAALPRYQTRLFGRSSKWSILGLLRGSRICCVRPPIQVHSLALSRLLCEGNAQLMPTLNFLSSLGNGKAMGVIKLMVLRQHMVHATNM